MTRRAYLYFALTFILGVVVGFAGTMIYGWYSGHWHDGARRHRVLVYLRHELDLTDAETQQVNQIMEETEKKFQDLHKQMEPQFTAIREENRNEIRKLLTPQQLAKFNSLVEKWDARMKKRRPH